MGWDGKEGIDRREGGVMVEEREGYRAGGNQGVGGRQTERHKYERGRVVKRSRRVWSVTWTDQQRELTT